jgi:uncharacterized protein YjgD (DUF1641 family)
MAQATAVSDLATLEKKLDQIAAQVQYLTEEAERSSRRRQDRAELVQDVVPIANDAFGLLTEQLEEIQGYVDLNDLLRLLKRLLRNGRNLDKLLDQMESAMDLAQTVGPLADDMFGKATDLLQRAEQRGYFAAVRAGLRLADDLVASFDQGDAKRRPKVSLWSLLRQIRDQEVRQGLASVMRVLKIVGWQTAGRGRQQKKEES